MRAGQVLFATRSVAAAEVALVLHARGLGQSEAPERAGLTRMILPVVGLGVAAKLELSAALANPTVQQKIFERAVAQRMGVDNSTLLADDGSLYALPLGSKEVRIGRAPRPP